jgi:hypothetical protein
LGDESGTDLLSEVSKSTDLAICGVSVLSGGGGLSLELGDQVLSLLQLSRETLLDISGDLSKTIAHLLESFTGESGLGIHIILCLSEGLLKSGNVASEVDESLSDGLGSVQSSLLKFRTGKLKIVRVSE